MALQKQAVSRNQQVAGLEAVAGVDVLVGLVGHRGPVAAEHAVGPPPSEPHQVAVLSAGSKPSMGRCRVEKVEMDTVHAGPHGAERAGGVGGP